MGTQLPLKGAQPPPPIFAPCLFWPNGWMDQDATLYGERPQPKPHFIRRKPIPPCPPKWHSSRPPSFWPISIVPNGRPCQLLLSRCTNGCPKTEEKNVALKQKTVVLILLSSGCRHSYLKQATARFGIFLSTLMSVNPQALQHQRQYYTDMPVYTNKTINEGRPV